MVFWGNTVVLGMEIVVFLVITLMFWGNKLIFWANTVSFRANMVIFGKYMVVFWANMVIFWGKQRWYFSEYSGIFLLLQIWWYFWQVQYNLGKYGGILSK